MTNANGPLNPRLESTQDTPGRYFDFITAEDRSELSETALRPKYMQYWKYVVQYYSERQLTQESDKLNALAGLAKRFPTAPAPNSFCYP